MSPVIAEMSQALGVNLCGELVHCYDNVKRPCVRPRGHNGGKFVGCNPWSDTDHSGENVKVRVVEQSSYDIGSGAAEEVPQRVESVPSLWEVK